MQIKITIRKPNKKDIYFIRKSFGKLLIHLKVKYDYEYIQKRVIEIYDNGIIAEVEGKSVGYHDPKSIWVEPEYRRMGIGKELVDYLKPKSVRIPCWNIESIKLFESYGMKRKGEIITKLGPTYIYRKTVK